MSSKQKYFDGLLKRVEILARYPERDNEASRHDQLIYPILTGEFGLGWQATDLISQSTIKVPKPISESHIFRGSVPKIRKPDILIFPPSFEKNIAVVEEKHKHNNTAQLNSHRMQTYEYQALYECTWGILTDGERWIVKRNFETFHEFSSIYELISGMDDFRHCLGRSAVLDRIQYHQTSDVILVVTSPKTPNSLTSLVSSSELFGFENNIPVIVCGVENRTITRTGRGYEEFLNFESALSAFPDLHPRIGTNRFTWAMKETKDGKISRLRFETWPACDLYSS